MPVLTVHAPVLSAHCTAHGQCSRTGWLIKGGGEGHLSGGLGEVTEDEAQRHQLPAHTLPQ
eukprot:2353448-Rhodomonas_salina.1